MVTTAPLSRSVRRSYHPALSSSADVRAELREVIASCDSHVLIDCSQMTFIDSTGITVLLETHRDLAARGREMLIANVPPQCQKVFDILGLNDLLRYDRSVATP